MDPIKPIPNIQVVNTYKIPNVNNVYIPRWMTTQPNVDYLIPPVVIRIGNPIVDIPGCVKAHKDNKKHKTNIPIDKDLVENDSGEAMTLCPDGSYPSYNAMNYEPEQLTIVREQQAPPVAPPPDPPGTPETPDTGGVTPDEDVPCPGPNAPRIGDVAQNQKEKVSGYELQPDPANPGKEICVILYEDISIVEAYLPSANVATTTAAIATVAGASALLAKPLADLLLRVFKPAIKQVLGKVNKLLGKTPYRPTQAEIKTNEYRVKKGLTEISFAKNHAKKIKDEKKKK